MEDTTDSPPARKPYQNWRSQQSSNWRLKDETPRPEQPARTQQRSFDQRRENSTPSATEATPGTRLYVGNLLYSAQGTDVEQFFTDNGFRVAHVNMSTDPFSGRNPSYCFVDLETTDEASRAMNELNGKEVLGRPVKINSGMKKSATGSTPRREWGSRDGTPTRTTPGGYTPNGPTTTRGFVANEELRSKRLYVGGLPQLGEPATVTAEIQEIFQGFKVDVVSKLIAPHESKQSESGNHFYLFVEATNPEEAEKAIEALDGKEMEWGGRLRVSRAKPPSGENKKGAREPRVTLDDFAKLRLADKQSSNGTAVQP